MCFLENMAAGYPGPPGFFHPPELRRSIPGWVIGRISGYGQTGPYSAKPGFGTLAEAMSGFTHLNAHPGQPPTNPPCRWRIWWRDCI